RRGIEMPGQRRGARWGWGPFNDSPPLRGGSRPPLAPSHHQASAGGPPGDPTWVPCLLRLPPGPSQGAAARPTTAPPRAAPAAPGEAPAENEPSRMAEPAWGLISPPSDLLVGGSFREGWVRIQPQSGDAQARLILMQGDLLGQIAAGGVRANGSIGVVSEGAA